MKIAKTFSPDEKDNVYLALALKLKCGLWSNDRALKEKQSTVVVYSTEEIIKDL